MDYFGCLVILMKKILLIFVTLTVALTASAKFRWGPTAGVNFSDYHWNQQLIKTDILPGFQAGVIGEVMIPGIGFGFDFGLRYQMRGGRVHFEDQPIWSTSGIGSTNLWLHTIQVPVNLRFKWTRMEGLENYIAPFAYVGPQFNFNVAGTNCDATKRAGAAVGIQVGLGVELWKKFQVSGGYVWDVTYDQRTLKLDNFNSKLQGGYIDFAYLF